MAFDIGVSFSVQTQELLNAKSALQSLVQTAKDLNTVQDKAASSADKLAKNTDKIVTASEKATASLEKTADSLGKVSKATPELSKQEQALLDLAKAAGVSDSIMQQLSGTFSQSSRAKRDSTNADRDVTKALAFLDKETRKVIETTDAMSRGFTSASANALFRYKEALQATGVSALELKQRLYTLEQDLMKRQGTSPFSKMREDIKKVTEQTNHLSRAISVQLGDVAISLAGGQNPFVVLLQQGDQIRGAVQQAVDAGQSINKAMAGAFTSMFTSFKLVGTVVKEFAMDGLRSVADSFEVVARHTARVNDVNKQFADGTISATRHSRLMQQAALQNAEALGTLRLVALGTAAAIGVTLVAAFVSLSKEQDAVAKVNAQFGASFGATSEEALNMARSMNDLGVNTATAISVMSGLMKSGNIGKEAFEGIALAASEAQKWVGISVEDTVKKFAELAKDPVKVLGEFTQQTGYLSQAQIQLVRDLREAGDEAKAQEVAIGLLKDGYSQMSSQARQDMSALGRVITEITSTTDTMWDAFKNSAAVGVALKAFKLVLDVVAVSVHAVYSVIRDVATGIALVIDIASNPTGNLTAKWDAFKESIIANGKAHDEFSKKVILGTQATEGLTAAERERNSSLQQVIGAVDKYTKAQETSVKSQVKTMQQSEYVAARVAEDIKKYTEGLTKTQREAFLQDERYQKARIEAEKNYAKEWKDAQSKSAPKSYKALRDNELQETKKFYEEQLKQLKDFETQQSKINKDAFESKAITYGQYVAREIELVASSQQKQLAIIEQSEAAYRENIDKRRKAQEAAASAAIKEGGSASKINEKLSQELKNLSNEARTAEEGFKGLRAALENSANAKYAEFYKELSKAVFDSNEALKKFSQTVADNQRRRQEDLTLQRRLVDSYGAEAEAIKASASTMRSYEGAILDSAKALEEATKRRQELEAEMSTVVGIEAYMQLAKKVEEAVDHEKKIRLDMIETVSKAQRDANQAGADAMVAYNIEVFKEIRNALSEDIYNALFEGGSKGAASLKAVLKKMFKNYVINVFLNPIMGQVTGAVSSALGLSGVSQAAGLLSGGGGLSSLFNKSTGTVGSKVGDWLLTKSTDFGLDGMTWLSDASFNLGNTIKGIDTALQKIPGLEGGIGSVFSYASALGSIADGKYAQGIGTAVGTWFGGPIGSFVGSTVGSLLDGVFSGGAGTPHTGAAGVYSGGKLQTSNAKTARQPWIDVAYSSGMQGSIDAVTALIGGSLDALSKLTGKSGGYEVKLGYGSDNNDPSFGAYNITNPSGNSLASYGWATKNFRFSSDAQKGYGEYLADISGKTLDIISKEFTGWISDLAISTKSSLEGMTGEQAIQALQAFVQQVVTIEQVFTQLGNTMKMFNGISDEMKNTLLKVFGSIENLSEAAGSFYQNFYSEEERLKAAGDNMNSTLKSLGLSIDVFSGDAAKADFRKAVEEAFSANNTGLASALLAISGSFAEVADAAQAASSQVDKAADSFWEAYARLAEKAGYTGSVRAYNADVVAGEIKQIFANLGVEKDIGLVTQAVLSATKKDVEDFFKQLWPLMQTGEAKSNLIDISDALLDIVESGKDAEQALHELTNSIVSELTDAFNSMNSAANLLQKIETALTGSSSSLVREQQLWESISTSDYRKQIELAGELSDIILSRYQAEQQNSQKLLDFGKSLQAYVNGLKIGNLSTLTPAEKLAEAGKQYADTLKKAQAGDESAKSALQGASSAYLDLARTYFASSEDYTKIFNSVTGSLESLGISSQTDAQKQLEVSSQNLSELKKLESIVSGAYAKAKTDFDVQKNLLQLQIDQMLRTANGIEAVRDILGSLSPELSGQINSGGALGKPGGVGASSFDTLAKQYVDILGSKSPTQDLGYIAAYMSNLDYAKFAEEYNNAYALLQDDASRSKLLALFQNLAKLNNIPIDGSHRSGLDNVPFNGYVAELHKGERVLTATENRSYGASMVGTNSALVAEVRLLRQEVAILRSENREDAKMQASVTARASELNAKTVVEGVGEAASKETYSNNLGAKLR